MWSHRVWSMAYISFFLLITLSVCKFWCFHSSDCSDCGLLIMTPCSPFPHVLPWDLSDHRPCNLSSTLWLKATCSYETLILVRSTTWCHKLNFINFCIIIHNTTWSVRNPNQTIHYHIFTQSKNIISVINILSSPSNNENKNSTTDSGSDNVGNDDNNQIYNRIFTISIHWLFSRKDNAVDT